MTADGMLEKAHAQFTRVLGDVGDGDWTKPTPCTEWDVRGLVGHLIGGAQMTVQLLDGASRDEAISAIREEPPAGDLKEACVEAMAAEEAAFRAPGALERTVHHPIGDVPGSQLRDFRIGDFTLHSWDLSRALGDDVTLDDELVGTVWGNLEPISSIIASIGVFGDGPSGSVSEDAELQLRLLDLTGRRP